SNRNTKGMDRTKTLMRIFLEGCQDDFFNLRWHIWEILAERGNWHRTMLEGNLGETSLKWALPTQPFVHQHGQRVLVATAMRMPLNLLGGHIGNRACHFLRLQ